MLLRRLTIRSAFHIHIYPARGRGQNGRATRGGRIMVVSPNAIALYFLQETMMKLFIHAHKFTRQIWRAAVLLKIVLAVKTNARAQITPERVNTFTRQCVAP